MKDKDIDAQQREQKRITRTLIRCVRSDKGLPMDNLLNELRHEIAMYEMKYSQGWIPNFYNLRESDFE